MFETLFTGDALKCWAVAAILAIGLVGVKLLYMNKDRKRNKQR